MSLPFPFGLPLPTQLYLTLYVGTWILHVVLMNYVLAGSAYLAIAGSLHAAAASRPAARVLRDWLPAALSAAITAGVAPLLFVQIIYRESFYTGNLLLFPRWLGIIPALILGFYLLYVWKVKSIGAWPAGLRIFAGWVALGAFLFTAWSWTENHLISSSPERWPQLYAEGPSPPMLEALVRWSMWLVGALAPMSLTVGWQLRQLDRDHAADYVADEVHGEAPHLARLAMAGIVGECMLAGVYVLLLEAPVRSALMGAAAGSYVLAGALGAGLALFGWRQLLRTGRWEAKPLMIASGGTLLLLLGIAVARETVRMERLQISRFFDHHAQASEIGGFGLFLAFLTINVGLMAWCVVIARRGIRRGTGLGAGGETPVK